MSIFSFVNDFGNHNSRKIDRFENDTLSIDTCRVSDGMQPYETAVMHSEYNSKKWIIVEAYDTIEKAREGHSRWVERMTNLDLPIELTDCANAAVAQFIGKESFPGVK